MIGIYAHAFGRFDVRLVVGWGPCISVFLVIINYCDKCRKKKMKTGNIKDHVVFICYGHDIFYVIFTLKTEITALKINFYDLLLPY